MKTSQPSLKIGDSFDPNETIAAEMSIVTGSKEIRGATTMNSKPGFEQIVINKIDPAAGFEY